MIKVNFNWPSEQAIKKHGNFNCVMCKKEGLKVKGMVCTNQKSICFRRDNCACEKHLDEAREKAFKQLQREKELDNMDYTEADYQTWMRV